MVAGHRETQVTTQPTDPKPNSTHPQGPLLSPGQQGHFLVSRNRSKEEHQPQTHDGHKQRAAWTCVGSPLHVWAHASPHSESGCPHALLADVTQAQPSPQSYDRRYPFVAMFWVKTS